MKRLLLPALVLAVISLRAAQDSPASPLDNDQPKTDHPTHFRGWGNIIDPDGDCQFFHTRGALLISVPGSSHPHDLAAEIGVVNAPRIVRPIHGDFVVRVRIDGRFSPGGESTLPGRTGYNGAGLILMADERNVVTLARATLQRSGSKPEPYANFEMRSGGELQRIGLTDDHSLPMSGPLWLRLERHGQTILGSVSIDGTHWDSLESKEFPADWPRDLQVGVAAISTSQEEFDPRFSQFEILD